MKQHAFTSSFAADLNKFIAHKRAIGYIYETAEWTLKGFDEFCINSYPKEHELSRALMLHWAEHRRNESIGTLRHRVTVIRQFGLFMKKVGHMVYILPHSTLPTYQRYVPYIYSRKELSTLFSCIDSCAYWPSNPIRHIAFPLIFRLLYCCGLRVSETCTMKLSDIDLNTGVLTVRNGKNNKDRIIPLSDNLTLKCRTYCKEVHSSSKPDTYLFPSRRGQRLSEAAVYGSFRQFLWKAGISHDGKGNGPRLHDLRHTFAVHCLKRWAEAGCDLTACLPVLKTYLGHTQFRYTAYYLRLTADVFPSITKKLEQSFEGLIPQVGTHYEKK
jgi:integrase/recombinase XerD